MMDFWSASWRAYLTLTATTLETMLAAQKASLNFTDASGRNGLPTFGLPDETEIRDAFHKAAGDNLKRWEDTADILQSLPDWYQDMGRIPGTVLTDWFDKARRSTEI